MDLFGPQGTVTFGPRIEGPHSSEGYTQVHEGPHRDQGHVLHKIPYKYVKDLNYNNKKDNKMCLIKKSQALLL